jgi:hypothetical protein
LRGVWFPLTFVGLTVGVFFILAIYAFDVFHHAQGFFELWDESEVKQERADETCAVQHIVSSFHIVQASTGQPDDQTEQELNQESKH